MKLIEIFLTFIFFFTIGVLCEKNIKNKENGNILDTAEIYFARVFEDEFMKLKEEYPLRLSEDILSIKILSKLTFMNNYEAFDNFQWKSQNFILGATNNETCMFLVTFSDDGAVLREFIKVEHLNFVEHVDNIKVLINDDTLWIFETSNHGSVVLVIGIKLKAGISTSIFQQVITTSNPLLDFHPYIHRGIVGLGVISQGTNEITEITIFSEENGIFLRQFEETLSGRYKRMNSFVDNQNSFLVFIGEQKTLIERYDGNKTEEFWNSSMKTENFFSLKDEISHNLFLGFIREENVDLRLFRGEKLLDWNKIPTNSDVKIGHVFTFKFRNFLILPNLSNISIYTQNAVGEYFPKWVMDMPCDNLKKVDALVDDAGIVFVSFCEDAQEGFYFHHLRMMDEEVSELQSDSPQDELRVEKCLDELESVLKRNELLIPGLLNSVHKGGFLRSDISIPMWESRREEDLTVASSSNKLDDVRTEVDNLSRIVATLKNKTKSLEDELPNLLTYEGDQHIDTTVIASKMVANYSVLMSIDLEKLNEITLDDYRTKFLVMDRPQIVNTDFIIDKIVTKNVNAKSLSTGSLVLLPENLLDRKNPNQIITGKHKFSSLEVRDDIVSSSPGIDNEINDININDIVSKFSDVRFEGRQEFQKTLVSEEYLKIKYLNEVDYDVWSQSVMKSKNGASPYFGGSIVVEGNVRVAGNVKAVAVNGIDFNTLYGNIAKKSSLVQEFADKMVFTNGLEVDSLEVERVNDLAWSNYLRKRDEEVRAHFNIDEGVILTDLKSEDINGLNFGRDVLLSGPDQIINGRITLVRDVDVTSSNGVTMETGATVNAIDPSLHSQIGQVSNIEVFDKKLNLGDVLIINGDIRVPRLNKITFPDFKGGFWTKSDHQQIPTTVAIRKADFKKSLYASTLNKFEVSDYVRSDVAQTLMARNFFVSDVLVNGDIYIENNRTINKVDLSALKNSALTLHGTQIINGHTEFTKTLNVNNFVTKVGTLKGINIQDDFVTPPRRYQNLLAFASPVEAHSFHAKDLQVTKLNGKDTLDTVYHRGTSISEIKGDLYAKRVKVNELIFTKNLNGENFNQWISSVASKGKSSLVFPEKVTIRGDVAFTGALDVDFLNSKHLKTFVKQLNRDCDECEVRGTKSFVKPVEVFGNLFAEYINGVSLHELKERLLSKTKEQTIKGTYKFKGGLTSVKIEAPKISGIPIEEIVLVNNINLELPTKFKNDVSFDEILSKDGWIDGCKLEEISNPPFSNVGNFNQNISFGHLEISGNMIVEGKILLRAISGDLRNFVGKLVTKSSEQNIFGQTRFQNEAWIQSLNSKYVNKLRSQEFMQKFIERRRDVQTNCNIEVEELLVNEAISTNVWAEAVNNVKLKTISNFGVKRGSAQEVIGGKKSFPNAFVNGNFNVKRINNVDFEDLIKLDEDNSESKLVFMKPITFTKNVWVNGLIADENANSLFKHFDPTIDSNSLPFPSKYDQLIIEGDLNVNAVNNVKLDDLFLKMSKSWIVTGKKNLIGGVIIEGESKIDVINGFRPNQFRGDTFLTPQAMVERYSEDETSAKPSKNSKVALSQLIFVLQRVNEYNFKQIKVMFRKLFSITRADEVQLPGDRIHSLRMSQSTVGHVFAEYDACLSRNLCPCFDTYTLTINRSKLELESESFKGRNFYILLSAENRLYNFNVRCSASEIFTSIGQFQLSAEGAVVLTQETKVFNLVQVLHFGGSERTYFLLYTKKGEDNEMSTLTVVNSNFEALWDVTFDARIEQLVLKQVFGDWYLLVVINQMEQKDMLVPEESRLYSWNANKEQFVLIRNLPAAASGDLTVFGNEIFLVLGSSNPQLNRVHEEKRSDVQIYKSVKRWPFEAFSSLAISEAGSVVFFTVDEALYLAVASRSENSVSVYRRILQEGFVLEESFFIINPSELNHLNIEDRHYLLLLSDNSVTLLNLNFKGVSVKNIL